MVIALTRTCQSMRTGVNHAAARVAATRATLGLRRYSPVTAISRCFRNSEHAIRFGDSRRHRWSCASRTIPISGTRRTDPWATAS